MISAVSISPSAACGCVLSVCRVDPHLIHEQYCFPQKFHDFFNLNESGDPNKDTCAILTAEGRTFPVDIFYTVRWRLYSHTLSPVRRVSLCVTDDESDRMFSVSSPVPDYVKATVETVMKIHETEDDGDVLAFLTGQVCVRRVCVCVCVCETCVCVCETCVCVRVCVRRACVCVRRACVCVRRVCVWDECVWDECVCETSVCVRRVCVRRVCVRRVCVCETCVQVCSDMDMQHWFSLFTC